MTLANLEGYCFPAKLVQHPELHPHMLFPTLDVSVWNLL